MSIVQANTVLVCPWCSQEQMDNVEDFIPYTDTNECDTITEDCVVCGRSISIRPAGVKKYKVWRTV